MSKPNDWSKSVGEAKNPVAAETLTPTKQLQLQDWQAFHGYLSERRSFLKGASPQPQAALPFALGRSGFSLVAVASTFDPIAERWAEGSIRAQINIEGPNAPSFFTNSRPGVQRSRPRSEPLSWIGSEDVRRRRILIQRAADLEDRTDWASQHAWLREKLELLHRVFAPLIRQLATSVTLGDEGRLAQAKS